MNLQRCLQFHSSSLRATIFIISMMCCMCANGDRKSCALAVPAFAAGGRVVHPQWVSQTVIASSSAVPSHTRLTDPQTEPVIYRCVYRRYQTAVSGSQLRSAVKTSEPVFLLFGWIAIVCQILRNSKDQIVAIILQHDRMRSGLTSSRFFVAICVAILEICHIRKYCRYVLFCFYGNN